MQEAQDVDMDNGGDCHKEVEERHSPLKSESSQPKRKSPLRTCKKEIVDDETDTGSQPRQGSMGGVPTANGSETKIRTKGHSQIFIEGLEPRFKKLCEVGRPDFFSLARIQLATFLSSNISPSLIEDSAADASYSWPLCSLVTPGSWSSFVDRFNTV